MRLFSALLFAYLLPSGALLRHAVTRAEGESTPLGTLSGIATLEDGQHAPFTLQLKSKHHCALELPPAVSATRDLLLELACPLVTLRGGSSEEGESILRRFLERQQIALAPIALTRLNSEASYVLGVAPQQLWLSRQEFRPVRLSAKAGARTVDLRIGEWSSPAVGDSFPRTIELWEGDRALLKLSVERATR